MLSLYWQRDWNRANAHIDHARYFTLPEGETIHWPIFWISEVFTPSTLQGFLRGLEKAGWSSPRSSIRREDEVREWILAARSRPGASGWMNLVTVRPKGKRRFWDFNGIEAILPNGVDRVSIQLHQLTGSLTLLHAAFFLDDESLLDLDRKLKELTEPRIVRERGRRRRTVYDTHFAKRHDLEAAFRRRHRESQQWLAKFTPGMFWKGRRGMPAVLDLIITQVGEPGVDRQGLDRYYLDELGVGGSFLTWKCIDIEGLSLHERRATFNTKDGGLILAGRYADVFDDSDFEHTGDDGKTLNKVAWRLNQYYISGIASCLATRELLEMLESEQAVTRDLAKRTHGRGTARSSLKLRDQVFGTSLDIAAITRDVQMLTSDRRWYGRDVLDFEQCWRPPREAEAIRLVESLRKQQRRTARRLATEDRQLRDILQMGATLAATAKNIRTERWALVAAVLSLVVAVGALLLTLAST